MNLEGCQIIPIDVKFHFQKCLEIFDKNSVDKIQFKNYKEVNPPCLIAIRVKWRLFASKICGEPESFIFF